MSFLTTYWVWTTPGEFYGMPWVNLAGWFGTGLVLMTALSILDNRSDWSSNIPTDWEPCPGKTKPSSIVWSQSLCRPQTGRR